MHDDGRVINPEGAVVARSKGKIKTFPDDRLNYLFEAARLGTMRAASDYFDTAPSTISRQIASLEKEIGVDLVEKNRHTIRLTDAGARMLEYYRDRLAQRESLLAAIDDLKGLRKGSLTLAIGQGLIRIPLVEAIQEFTERFPGVSVRVRSVSSRNVVPLVCEDDVHFGAILDAPHDPRIRTRSVFHQPLRLIAASNHALAGRKSVAITELLGHRLVLPEEGFRVRQLLNIVEREQGIFLNTVLTASSIQMLTDCVLGGVGATIIPEDCVSDHIKSGTLVAIPIDDLNLSASKIHIIVRIGRRLPASAVTMLEILERNLAK